MSVSDTMCLLWSGFCKAMIIKIALCNHKYEYGRHGINTFVANIKMLLTMSHANKEPNLKLFGNGLFPMEANLFHCKTKTNNEV